MDNPKFKIDSEFRDLLPPLTPEEYKDLEESILQEKLRDPLWIWKEKGILIDGHNRYAICKKHGINYRTREKSFNSREEAKLWIWENQTGQRNMTTFQKIEAALKLKDAIAAQAKKNQQDAGGAVGKKVSKAVKPIRTNQVIGEKAGVSHVIVKKVEDILKKVAEGVVSEKDINDLRQGKAKISSIHRKYCGTQPTEPDTNTHRQASSKEVEVQVNTTISSLNGMEQKLSHQEDRIYFYDKVIAWARARKQAKKPTAATQQK